MATRLKEALIPSMVGGLNTYANATQVADNESPDMLNTEFKGITAITKRRGYSKLTTSEIASSHKVQGLFSYITSSVRQVLYISNGVLYKYNGSGGSTQITGGTFSTSANVNGVQIGTRLYFFDGVTGLSYYDGTNIVTTGVNSAPTYPTQGIVFNRRMYINSNANKDRVYYGGALTSTGAPDNTGDFRATSPAYAGYFGFGEGKEVVGFAKLGSSLYIFLRDSIQKLDVVSGTGTSSALDHSAALISNSIGCQAPRSIENVNNDVYFLDSTVYSLGEAATYVSLRTSNISGKIANAFKGMSQSDLANASGIFYNREEMYLIAVRIVSSNTYNDHVLGYSTRYKAWSYWDGLKVNSWLDFIDSSGEKHLYFGSDNSSASYVYEAFQGLADDGAAVSSYYKTKEFDLKKFNIEKLFQDWAIQLGGIYGILTVYFYVDGVLSDTKSFSSGSGVGTANGVGTFPIAWKPTGMDGNAMEISSTESTISNDWRWHDLGGLEGTTFQFVFENNNLNESYEIKQATAGYLEMSHYKRSADREV